MSSNAHANPYAPPQAELEGAGTGMDASFKLNLLSPAGRIGRIRYLGYLMGLWFVLAFVVGLLAALTNSMLIVGLVYLAMIYLQFMLTIKRSHDCNWSGWMSLLVFVPVAGLIFLVVPGTDGPNRFGNKTAPNGKGAWVVVVVAVIVPLIGILAAIAIPAYQDYVHRAQAGQVQAR